MIVAPGATQLSIDVQFLDDSGFAVTGKVAADFPACKWSGGSNTADTTITLSDLAAITTAHPNDNTAGGVKEREGGWYRLDLPNNVVSSAGRKTITFAETTNKHIVAPFVDCQLAQTNAIQINGTNQTARDVGASVLLSAGTGAGQLDFTAGVVKSNLVQILATALTETAGQIAGAFKQFFNIAGPTGTVNDLTTLTGRLTAARAGYLDNLNVGGNVASHADILAINQSASRHLLLTTVMQYEPGEAYTIEARTFAAADGSAVNADTTPTLTATGKTSGSLAANLSAATNPATGVYRWTYTVPGSPTLEQIGFDLSATISAATFTLAAYTQTVDEATVVWTSTDQSHLTSIFNKLPAGSMTQPGDAMALTGGERTSLIAALFATVSEGAETFIQAFRLMRSGIVGKLSGAPAGPVIMRDAADTKNRITATVDASGNRSAVTTDGT